MPDETLEPKGVSGRKPLQVPWIIPITSSSTAAGSTWQTSPSQAVGPYNFVWTRWSIQTSVSAGVWEITVKDESQSEQFMLSGVRSNLLVPDDAKMVDLVRPWRFHAHSSIYVQAINRHASDADILYLALHGYLEK